MEYNVMLTQTAISQYCSIRSLENLAPLTISTYHRRLDIFAQWLESAGLDTFSRVRANDLMNYLVYRRSTHKPNTVYLDRTILAGFFQWAYGLGISRVSVEAIPRVRPAREDEILRLHVTSRDVHVLLNKLRDKHLDKGRPRDLVNLALISILFGTGARISEVANIKLADISADMKEIYICKAKGNRPRYVAVAPSILGILGDYTRVRREAGGEWLFQSWTGTAYRAHALGNKVRRLGREYGIELTAHSARRFVLTKLAAGDLLETQRQAGHAHLKTTLVYLQQNRDNLHRVMRKCDPLR